MYETVELILLKEYTSHRLIKKLLTNNIETIGQLKNISMNDFQNIKSIGEKTVKEFADLKKLIENESKLNKILDFYIASNIAENIQTMPIKYLKSNISNKLMNIFEENGCVLVKDAINISIVDMLKTKSIGEKTISEFVDFLKSLHNNSIFYLDEYKKNAPPIYPESCSVSILDDLGALINEYFLILNDQKGKEIVYKRFGLFGNNSYTLEEIGSYFGITRERVRQIENKHLERIKELFNGSIIKNPYMRLRTYP
jgi:hypothetical protein